MTKNTILNELKSVACSKDVEMRTKQKMRALNIEQQEGYIVIEL